MTCCSEEKYSELEKEREQFAIHQGPKLQRYLIIRRFTSPVMSRLSK